MSKPQKPGTKKAAAKTAKPPKNESRGAGWLPYQRVLIDYREAGHSITALGKQAGVDIAQLSRATTTPGKALDDDVLRRLVPHVPGMADAVAAHLADVAAFIGLPEGRGINADPGDGRTLLSFRQIHQSLRLNPRKTFDHDAIAELAESIAQHGVLQNLTVRATGRGGYEIVAGERRWRAIGNLIEESRWDAETANIPVKIIDADEGQARTIALLENLQRVEISPLEEAGAFAELQALDPDTWTTDAIAKAIGKDGESGQRYVLQRLALAYKLDTDARDCLRNGRLTFEKARYLTQFRTEVQRQVVAELERGDPDLVGLFDAFRGRVQAIDAALSPQTERPAPAAPKSGATRPEPAYRSNLERGGHVPADGDDDPADGHAEGDEPAPESETGDFAAEDLALGLPDPATWSLQTSTERLLTITLMAPSAEAFEAALRLFARAASRTEAA